MNTVRILNPAHQGGNFTSRQRAERYIRRGVAKWVSASSIKFIEEDHRHNSAVLSVAMAESQSAALSQIGYDQVGRMRLDQVQGLPCAGPAIRVFMIPSKRGNGYGR